MKLSLKSINGKLRILAQRIEQGLKFVADCCCITQPPPPSDRYVIFGDCCGLSEAPAIAVKVSLVIEFVNQCSNNIGFVVVRLPGQDRCYSARWPPDQLTLSLETVLSLGIQPLDTTQQVQCVETRIENPPFQCRTTSCPECPRDCCLALVYGTRQCPDIQSSGWFNPASDPSDLICCSYGRQCLATWRHTYRTQERSYGSCSPESGGCFGNRILNESLTQYADEEVRRFVRCNADGTSPGDYGVECISHNHYARELSRSLDPCSGSVTGINDREFERWSRCVENTDPGVLIRGPLPPSIFFPARARRVVVNRSLCDGGGTAEYIEEETRFNQDLPSVCEDVENEVVIRQTEIDRDCSVYQREITTTTFRYGVSCLQGSYYFEQSTEVRAYGFGCPPDGSLLYTRDIRRSASYFINVEATEYCDPTLCDQYRRRFGASAPITRVDNFNAPPVQGALSLL